MPWHYVLADAAVSGTLACRTGYTLATSLVERREESGMAWFLIDDLSRMSRNTIESLRLGELADETGVRVIGASDGFNSANPQSFLLLPLLGLMNVAFITQLRSKVKRGMDDAFRRGDNIQPPGVGYRLVDVKDADGNLVITHKAFAASTRCTGFMAAPTAATSRAGSSTRRCSAPSWRSSSPTTSSPI